MSQLAKWLLLNRYKYVQFEIVRHYYKNFHPGVTLISNNNELTSEQPKEGDEEEEEEYDGKSNMDEEEEEVEDEEEGGMKEQDDPGDKEGAHERSINDGDVVDEEMLPMPMKTRNQKRMVKDLKRLRGNMIIVTSYGAPLR
jgi:hypothetical protein